MRCHHFKMCRGFLRRRKTRNRRRRQHCDLRHWLRNSYVPHMANLAMLLVGFVSVPVPRRLHRESAHAQNQRQGQQS